MILHHPATSLMMVIIAARAWVRPDCRVETVEMEWMPHFMMWM